MKHLSIIASGIAFISSYSFAAEHGQHKANFKNNLPNDAIIIFSVETGGSRNFGQKEHNLCIIKPNETQQISLTLFNQRANVNITTTTIAEASWFLGFKNPLPQNITFIESRKAGPAFIDILYDDKYHVTIANKRKEIIAKQIVMSQVVC